MCLGLLNQLTIAKAVLTLHPPSTDIHTCSSGKQRERVLWCYISTVTTLTVMQLLLFNIGLLMLLCCTSLKVLLAIMMSLNTTLLSLGDITDDKRAQHPTDLVLWNWISWQNPKCKVFFWGGADKTYCWLKKVYRADIYWEKETERWGQWMPVHSFRFITVSITLPLHCLCLLH